MIVLFSHPNLFEGKSFLSWLTVCVCSLICWASKSENFVFLGDIVVLPTVTYFEVTDHYLKSPIEVFDTPQ